MKHEGQTVLRVFLKSGPVLDLVLPRQEAFGALDWWKTNATSSGSLLGGVAPDGANYLLQASEIAALVVMPLQPQQQALQQTAPPQLPQKPSPFGTIQFPGPRA